ncbi:MAG: CdaR family protein [Longimicrobiales bacterium]
MNPRILEKITDNWALKLTALAIAFLLWGAVKAEVPERLPVSDVPVRVVARDGDWEPAAPPAPSTVEIVFSGPTRELVRLAVNRPEVLIPVDAVSDSVETRVLRAGWVQLYGGMDNTRVEDIRPSTVTLRWDRVVSRLVPVSVQVIGTPAAGYRLSGPVQVEPTAVRVNGGAARVSGIDTIRLGPIDLSGWTATDSFPLGVDTTEMGVIVSPMTVRIVVPIEPLPDSITNAAGMRALPRDTANQ